MDIHPPLSKQAKIIRFILCHALAFFLFFTWVSPVTNAIWARLDTAAFQFLNGTLDQSPLSQIFWALANLKVSDLFGAIFMVGFSLLWVYDADKEVAKKRLAQFIYLLIWFEIGIFTLKEIIYPTLIKTFFMRESPSLHHACTIFLSKAIPWIKVKDYSRSSYPGDHALIVLQWAGFMTAFTGWRIGTLAFITSTFFILPRLIGGAHWLSDVLAGSLPLALIFIAWAIYTPIYEKGVSKIQKFLTSISQKRARYGKNRQQNI
jgi:membrane-associated phospholipid phosphatase